jgi:hypothetical protein
MGKILFILAVLVLLVMVVTVALLKMLGAKGLVLAFILVLIAIWGGIKVIGKVFKALLVSPFKAKGQVLRDATVKVNAITSTGGPAVRVEDDDEGCQRDFSTLNWYSLDVTITPGEACDRTPFQSWDADELALVAFDAQPVAFDDDKEDDCEVCLIYLTEIWLQGDFRLYESMEDFIDEENELNTDELVVGIAGPERLRMMIGVKPGDRRLKFEYHLEHFGDIRIP